MSNPPAESPDFDELARRFDVDVAPRTLARIYDAAAPATLDVSYDLSAADLESLREGDVVAFQSATPEGVTVNVRLTASVEETEE